MRSDFDAHVSNLLNPAFTIFDKICTQVKVRQSEVINEAHRPLPFSEFQLLETV